MSRILDHLEGNKKEDIEEVKESSPLKSGKVSVERLMLKSNSKIEEIKEDDQEDVASPLLKE